MSLLPPEVHTQLSQLLSALSTPDNAIRSQAEEQLNNDWVQNKPDVLLMGLAEQIGGAGETIVSARFLHRSLPCNSVGSFKRGYGARVRDSEMNEKNYVKRSKNRGTLKFQIISLGL